MASYEKAQEYLDLERRMFEIFQGGQLRREMLEDNLLPHSPLCHCPDCDAKDEIIE